MMSPNFYVDFAKDRYLRWWYALADKRDCLDDTRGSLILMFHHVGASQPASVNPSCFASTEEFHSLIKSLKNRKTIVSIDTLYNDIRLRRVPENMVVLTFDDVPDNFYLVAYPILKAYQAPFTLYIATSLMDTPGYLTSEQVQQLSKDSLCTIGSHTVSHCKVKEKGVDLLLELKTSKSVLEKLIGQPVNHFAFPYGTPFAISRSNIHEVAESGVYETAVSTIPGFIGTNAWARRFFLPRIHSRLYIDKYQKKK